MSDSVTNSPEIVPTSSKKSYGTRRTARQIKETVSESLETPDDNGELQGDPQSSVDDMLDQLFNNEVVDHVAHICGTIDDDEASDDEDDCDENGCKKSSVAKKANAFKKGKNCGLPIRCKTGCHDGNWSERDRQRLLVALRRFGVLNIPELMKAVPGKSESEISSFIQMKWKAARCHLREELRKKKGRGGIIGPVDEWLNCLKDHFTLDFYKSTPLARAVLFIWKFENHPDPRECGGIDFKALYEHLYYVLRGFPPRELNQPSAIYLSESLKLFSRRIKLSGLTDDKQLISSLKVQKGVRKTKSDDDVIAALSYDRKQSFEELLKQPGFNPFGLPLDVLMKKGIDPDESSSVDFENAETSCETMELTD